MTFRPIDRRSLPPQVLRRLAGHYGVVAVAELFGNSRDRRAAGPSRMIRAELRAAGDGAAGPSLAGYATVFDVWYDVAGGPPWGWRERFAFGSLDRTLAERDDVRLLVNHKGLPIGRTKSRTLELEADDSGLLSHAPELDRRNPTVQELESVMLRGDADEMSLAFTALTQEWNSDYTERTIREARLFDVSVVTYPANPNTTVILGDAASAAAEMDPHDFVDNDGDGLCDVCGMSEDDHDDQMPEGENDSRSARRTTAPTGGLDLSLAAAIAEASRLRRAGPR